MILRAVESEISWLPNVKAEDIPSGLPPGISIHLRSGELGVEARGLVGSIPLLNGDTLHIEPKIGAVNFLRLLFRAEGSQPSLSREFASFVEYFVEDGESVDAIVARRIVACADQIMARSPYQGRVRRLSQGTFVAGKIDALNTARNIAYRKLQPVEYAVNERTYSTPENRILTEALAIAWSIIRLDARSKYLGIVERWMQRFDRSSDIAADLLEIERGFSVDRYGGSRDYYREALMLAQVLLGSFGLGFQGTRGVQGDAVLINTADVFERYLRGVLSDAFSSDGYVVTKGGPGKTTLYTDGTCELQPDIVISRGGRVAIVADAKYKRPSADDHYQMQVYVSALGVKRGLLLAPRYSGNEVIVNDFITREVRTVISEVFLPMRSLPVTEEFLAGLVRRFS